MVVPISKYGSNSENDETCTPLILIFVSASSISTSLKVSVISITFFAGGVAANSRIPFRIAGNAEPTSTA